MSQFSENKYLQLLLEDLIASYETEINYTPKEVVLDPSQIALQDIDTLLSFVTESRKRLFIFKIPGDTAASDKLALIARRSILNTTAKTILQNTSGEPKIYPLKKALSVDPSSVRARIQIQKSFILPQAPKVQKDTPNEQIEHVAATDLILLPIDSLDFPELRKQLSALGVEYLHDEALSIVKDHIYAFSDGIIPSNLPKGFYISKSRKALCYTDTPKKLPSALAPILKEQEGLTVPSVELTTILLPELSQTDIAQLLETKYSQAQKNVFISLFSNYENEFKTLFQLLKPSIPVVTSQKTIESLIPLLCKQFILGGEAHTILLVRLINSCLNKKINLEFLLTPEVQSALLSTRGIKNLQKLVQLPAEQKEWWNTLVNAHLQYDKNSFDFNTFFDAYTQNFLPRIAEKNLTLPNPCPIAHNGHLLITLNRVLDVIEHAENPQEQCLSLSGLNWGPTGVHYAMMQKPEPEQFKQVASCMKIESPEDTLTLPEQIYNEIEDEQLELNPWLFRYMGQHWNPKIRLSDIQNQLLEIEKLSTWSSVQKNQLTFILTCAFSDKTKPNVEQWKKNLSNCISLLHQLNQSDRSDLLQALSRCFKFKPTPSLEQINTLINQFIELKDAFPLKNFKTDLIAPLASCLENEGFDFLNTLQERIQKTDPQPEENKFSLAVTVSFMTMLQNNRHRLSPELSKLLAKLNEPDLNQGDLDQLLEALQTLQTKDEGLYKLVLATLSQINISKSQVLPAKAQVQSLIETLTAATETIPGDANTSEKQEAWLKNLIIDKNLLPGCVIGNGDISKLDDLIVDALVDAVKKRSAAFRIDTLKTALLDNLKNPIVPSGLRDQLNRELIPLFDAVHDLITLLQTPNPKFPDVIDRLRFFEEKKPILLEAIYGVSILGKTKGEYILSFLLTGKRKETDHSTGKLFAGTLSKLHDLFISSMNAFFDNPENKLIVKDLDISMALSWMSAFNETHSLTFFFREELVQKKVLPALKKTLQQLNTQDPEFEKSILDEASHISENDPSDQSLQNYKDKIESIANYLNLLIDINDKLPKQFNKIYKQLNTGALTRLNYTQKHILLNKLVQEKPEDIELYLKLTTQALEENPSADAPAVERAINGLVELFKLSELETETQIMFFKMSMTHNLKSATPFPLAALNELKKSSLPEFIKSLIIKQIIQILMGLSGADSSDLIQSLVQQTQLFLTNNPDPDQAELCITLLKRPAQENPNQDLIAYPLILQQLTQFNPEHRKKIATILTGLASSKKDDSVNLFALLEISKGLGRRSAADIDLVLKLFATLPYPNTQSLNTALLAHDSEKLRAYCESFDTNPFAKTGEKRDLSRQFATDRVKEALSCLQDLIHEEDLPYSLQMKLAQQLTFIETLGYTDPLNPDDFSSLKQLTARSRNELKTRASTLLQQLRSKSVAPEQIEITYLELIAHLREIYFRTTGLFPNTTQTLVLLLALQDPSSNLLMRIKTGEGKSINAPMLSVLQWSQGGTVDQCTANPTLLVRDFENSCEPFYKFLGIKTALIQSNTSPEAYQLDGINCSTVEDMSIFRLAAKEAKKEKLLENGAPIHIVLDECDDALLDQVILYKLVAETLHSAHTEDNPAEWIYPLAYQFVNLPKFRNINPAKGKVWDEDEDLEQFRLFLNKEINEKFNGNVEKQNYLMASTNTQLKQWIHASCTAATLVENKHFILQPLKEKDEAGQEITKKIICVPLIRSTPKTGSIFTEAVQQALQARLIAERKDQAQYFTIDTVPSVLSSQSSRGLIKFYQGTNGRLLGISATPGDKKELESLASSLGTRAISVAPYAGDKRKNHAPIFTLNREESFKAVHKTLDQIKCPITKPTMEINPDAAIQTYEEHQALIAQTKRAIEEWSYNQTQPILIINEDFDEAQALGASLNTYKEQGFKIQVITGKESPSELDRIIKQAGQVNTITVGTAMLAKGIDINTGSHPKGLFVIQTYPDTERMSTQIAGRAARNGKPGEWLPIYRIKTPEDLINKLFYYILPWRRQRINEHTVEALKNKIKLQATIDRLYTQAIDEVQQTLMQQIEIWEDFLLELYPDNPQIQFEFYQWREVLLSELTRSQATSISESTLKESISQFKKLACKLWESARDEKWAAKAEQVTQMNAEQTLKFKYLKQLDITQELTIQKTLQQKRKPFTDATKILMRQNLETIIADKAGVVLDYTKPSGQMKKDLELAQSKQILPNLIGAFCTVYPETIQTLIPESSPQSAFFVPDIITKFVNKLIEKKNKVLYNKEKQQLTDSIIHYYQKKLMNADGIQIQPLLFQIKELLLRQDLKKLSLVDQFKMQGLILSFCTLYQSSGLPEDSKLTQLQTSYNNMIMKKLAQHLLEQFAWAKEIPEPFHALFERKLAKEAAKALYDIAKDLNRSPENKDKIQALYAALQKHKIILKDIYLFSISHSSPRNVINDSLNAIDSLHHVPHCDLSFRDKCHDKVVSEYQLDAFRDYLINTSPYYFHTYDPVWKHLQETLLEIIDRSKENPIHVMQELYEATERYSTYEAYKPYLTQLKAFKKQLLRSLKELNQADGLKQDVQESLFTQKEKHFAKLFDVASDKVRIQNGSDGIQSYIEIQVEGATTLREGFTGYQSSYLARMQMERSEIKKIKSVFEENKRTLLDLSDLNAIDILPTPIRLEFEKLFRLKELLDLDWSNFDSTRNELPELTKKRLQQIDELKGWDWTTQPIDLTRLQTNLGKEVNEEFTGMIERQSDLNASINEAQARIEEYQELIRTQKQELAEVKAAISTAEERKKQSDCHLMEKTSLMAQILYNRRRANSLQNRIDQSEQRLKEYQEEKSIYQEELKAHNQLLDGERKSFIANLITQGKLELNTYLQDTSRQHIDAREIELLATTPALDAIEKKEQDKARYQTCRLFSTRELLRLEAKLSREQEIIPQTIDLSESDLADLDDELAERILVPST